MSLADDNESLFRKCRDIHARMLRLMSARDWTALDAMLYTDGIGGTEDACLIALLRGSSDARHHLPNWNRARDAAATRWAGRSDLASLMRGLR